MKILHMGRRDNKAPVTVHATLLRLAAAVEWLKADDENYGPAFFERCDSFQKLLASREPGASLRLWDTRMCWACAVVVDVRRGRHDHVVPTSQGGSPEGFNRAPACRACNVSRGSTDALIWFGKRGSFWDLPVDFLVVYARTTYRHCLADGSLGQAADEAHLALLDDFVARLPSMIHRDRFHSIYGEVVGVA